MDNVTSYRTYWQIWAVLLVLTLLMIVVESWNLPRAATVLVLTAAMLIKATLIAGWFMHLRYERLALVLIVVVMILGTAAFMVGLLIPDGIAAFDLAPTDIR